MSEPFDPNANAGDWATYVPCRRPKFKVHAHRGHAINAIKCHAYDYDSNDYDAHVLWPSNECKLYRRQDGRWVEVTLLPTYTREQPNIIDMEAESSRILAHIEAKRKEQKQ